MTDSEILEVIARTSAETARNTSTIKIIMIIGAVLFVLGAIITAASQL